MEDERKLTIEYLEEMKEEYIEGEGYERHPLTEWYALDKAIKALDQESCDDAISRQAAQAKIKNICDEYRLSYEDGERKAATGGSAYALGHAFDDLPPVTPTQRWVPVSERLPEPQEDGGDKDFSDWVQVSIRINPYQSIVCSAYYCFSEKKWYMERFGCGEIKAWMPLPEPYKAVKKCCSDCKHHTDGEEIHGVTPCGSCGADLRNFLEKKGL